CQQGYNYPCTF
nr:immunoglobulin light chain junction region [Macaca mulatta]